MSVEGVITRGNLPHWYVPGAAHFITYRIAGTIPARVLEDLAAKRAQLLQAPLLPGMTAAQCRSRAHKQLFADYDRYLDSHRDVDWLARPEVAAMIRGNLYHHNGAKYHLMAYCIMPNHVHVLLQPIPVEDHAVAVGRIDSVSKSNYNGPCGEEPDSGSPLSSIMHSLKSYTANKANLILNRAGQFWQHESYDHWVRDTDELERIVEYISRNPVNAGLVARPEDWYFGSAHDRFLLDGTRSGLLRLMTD